MQNFQGLQNSKFYHLFYIYKDPQTHWRGVMRVFHLKITFCGSPLNQDNPLDIFPQYFAFQGVVERESTGCTQK